MSGARLKQVLFAAALLLLPCPALAREQTGTVPAPRAYWADSWRGWHFYEEPVPEEEAAPSPSTALVAPGPAKRAPELVEFELLQRTLEEYRNIAIMHPTEANVRRYMELEARIVTQASRFADIAQRVAWASPELDPTLQGRPVNARALEVFDQEQLASRVRSISELGKDHVLLFFFRSDCPYCHAFAPALAAFQARHAINVVPISVDGGPMAGFADARRDNGIARTLNVTQVPALFLAQPHSGKITTIGFGVLSESQLLERISAAASTRSTEASVSRTNKRALDR